MSEARRGWWWMFAGCAAVVMAAMAWVTSLVLDLEDGETQLREEAEHQEAVRLSLWRMESWMAPVLAQEAARAWFEYQAYYDQQEAYTKLYGKIGPGEILSPSPLLVFESDHFPLHFQVGPDGSVSSPQVPVANQLDLAQSNGVDPQRIDAKRRLLEELGPRIESAHESGVLEYSCGLVEEVEPQTGLAVAQPQRGASAGSQLQQQLDDVFENVPQQERKRAADVPQSSKVELLQKAQQEWVARNDANDQVLSNLRGLDGYGLPGGLPTVAVGALTPLWLEPLAGGAQEKRLAYVRRVEMGKRIYYQGFLADWSRLQGTLLSRVGDLLREAVLEPLVDVDEGAPPSPRALASVPALLSAPAPEPALPGGLRSAHVILIAAWLAILLAVGAAAITLRSSIAFGLKRSRFASAVTHELRTPLTTFRLYSEMLADGMVTDEARKQEYLHTLKNESDRLARLVENVLTYARLEEGQSERNLERVAARELFERHASALQQRAGEASMELELDHADAASAALEVDVDAVGQILFNLVDNACKYANGAAERSITLRAEAVGEHLDIRVRDHGPGIRAETARRIFAPFDRGEREPGDTIPGVGLGLALSRDLAHDLGGRLSVDASCDSGACFLLRLPLRAA